MVLHLGLQMSSPACIQVGVCQFHSYLPDSILRSRGLAVPGKLCLCMLGVKTGGYPPAVLDGQFPPIQLALYHCHLWYGASYVILYGTMCLETASFRAAHISVLFKDTICCFVCVWSQQLLLHMQHLSSQVRMSVHSEHGR